MQHFPTRIRATAVAAASALSVLVLLAVFLPVAGAADSGSLLTWNKLEPSSAPPPRFHAALAFDEATGTTVLFGGRSGTQVLADTWTWDGSAWTAVNPPASPPPIESASMAYDSIGRRIILFGGIGSDGNATGATWAWNGTTWATLTPAAAPPPRYGASIASDSLTGTDVLFGGQSAPGSPLADTWAWDGSSWTPKTPAASPPARSGAAMTFDAARGVVVLFGGASGPDDRADTWTWDGTTWSQETPAASPPARTDAAIGFDAATQSAVLFGGDAGNSALGDTWLWNGANWSTSLPLSLLPTLGPPARAGASIATAPANQRLVLFGGQSTQPGGSTPGTRNDTWNVATLVTAPPASLPPVPSGPQRGPTTTVGGATTSTTTAGSAGTTTSTTSVSSRNPVAALPPAPLRVTSRSVRRGEAVRVSGSGFAPVSPVVITFHSAVVNLGTALADEAGRFSATVLVPADAPPGSHHIQADGTAKAGRPAKLVVQVSITGPAGHHSWWLPATMVAFTVLLAAGAWVALTPSTEWGRRRRAA